MEKALFFLVILPLVNTQNLIVNGDFSLPVYSTNGSWTNATFWKGSNFKLEKMRNMSNVQGQYCNLQ